MTNQLHTHQRVIGALLGIWLTLFVSSLFVVGFAYLTVPLAAAFGATRWAQRFARPSIALVGGITTGSFVGDAVASDSVGLVFITVATTVLYLMLGDLGPVEDRRPSNI